MSCSNKEVIEVKNVEVLLRGSGLGRRVVGTRVVTGHTRARTMPTLTRRAMGSK